VKPHLDPERCKRWIELTGRDVGIEKIKSHSYICQDHFKPGDILDWKLNPSLEPVPMHDPNKIKEEKFESSNNESNKFVKV